MSLIDYNVWEYDLYNEYKICQMCEDGTTGSNCCGAVFYEPGYPDNDICSDCGEHAEPWICEFCEGEAEVTLTHEEIVELKDNEACLRADDFIKDQKEST